MAWDSENTSVADVAEFLREAPRDRYEFGREVDKVDREGKRKPIISLPNASDQLKEQWAPDKKKARMDAYRPVLQWNRIKTSVTQVVNSARQNRTAVRVAAGDGGNPKTADFLNRRAFGKY